MGKQRREALPMEFFREELDVDIMVVYRRLKSVAKLTEEQLKDRNALSAAINEAADNALLAKKIYFIARKERELFKIDYARSMRRLNREAIKRVEAWMKDNKIPSSRKQITKDMVLEEISASEDLREEYLALLRRDQELKAIRDLLLALADEWKDRKGTLQSQAKLLTSQREVVF